MIKVDNFTFRRFLGRKFTISIENGEPFCNSCGNEKVCVHKYLAASNKHMLTTYKNRNVNVDDEKLETIISDWKNQSKWNFLKAL